MKMEMKKKPLDQFSNFPSYEKANDPNVLQFLDMYNENHGIPRCIRLDQAKFTLGHQVKTFCNKHNIETVEAPVNNHWAIGLVERLKQTIMNRITCIKEEKLATNSFKIKHALRTIIHQL